MMPPTFRDPTPHEIAALQSLMRANDNIGIMPVKFNGQDRYAIALLHESPQGQFIQIVGILPTVDDELISVHGHKTETLRTATTEKPN
jgi:hypothetical protein